jgi:hypothetical protein
LLFLVQGYSCECPRGYQSIGDGHCVATVNPSVYQALSRDWDFSDYEEGTDDFLSSEGCFACQLNGGGGRSSKKGSKRRTARSRRSVNVDGGETDKLLVDIAALGGNVSLAAPSGDEKNYEIDLDLRPDQTAHRRRFFRIQAATSDLVKSVEYRIVSDSSGQLQLQRKSGVWGLFFRERVEGEGAGTRHFHVLIRGQAHKGPKHSRGEVLNALVRINVVP